MGTYIKRLFFITTPLPGSIVFERPPHKSWLFIGLSVQLVLIYFLMAICWVKTRDLYDLHTTIGIATGPVLLTLMWGRVLRDWLRIRGLPMAPDATNQMAEVRGIAAFYMIYGFSFLCLLLVNLIMLVARNIRG